MFHASSTAQYITIFFKPKKMFENGFKVKLLFVLTTSMSGSTEKNQMHLYEKVSDDLLEFDLLDDYIDPEITPFEKLSKKAKKGIMIDRLEKFVLEFYGRSVALFVKGSHEDFVLCNSNSILRTFVFCIWELYYQAEK